MTLNQGSVSDTELLAPAETTSNAPAETAATPAGQPAAPAAEAQPAAAAKPDPTGLLDAGEAAPAAPETVATDKATTDALVAEFKLTAPEGARFTDETLPKIAAFAKQHGLKPEQAQAMVGAYHEALQQAEQRGVEQVQATFAGWAKEIREHKEFGGSPEKIRQTSAYFAKAIDHVAPGYRQSLRDAGAMIEPALYLAFAKFGQAMSAPSGAVKGDGAPAAEPPYSSSFPATPKRLGGSKKDS